MFAIMILLRLRVRKRAVSCAFLRIKRCATIPSRIEAELVWHTDAAGPERAFPRNGWLLVEEL